MTTGTRVVPKVEGTLGPLRDGQTVAIVGGGPAGASCAMALQRLAQRRNDRIQVFLYEGKTFGSDEPHHNQCVGLLSPPIRQILERELEIPFPHHLVGRDIGTYILHSNREQVVLTGDDQPSHVVRRVQFDEYLLEQARKAGAQIVHARVTDVEIGRDAVVVYSETDTRRVDVVVGAFGLDDGACHIFERATSYRSPRFLKSIVTKVHPNSQFLTRFGNSLHAFLPSERSIEFGAVTPKSNHLTINIAGANVTAQSMDLFLALPAVRSVLPNPTDRLPPETGLGNMDYQYFKGKIPISIARNFYGDRYIVIGDAAGLVRPFKGKGVNAAIMGGIMAANAMTELGISRRAFHRYLESSPAYVEVKQDLIYAKVVRWLAINCANWGLLDPILRLAKREDALRLALFNSVSAYKPYREIVRETLSLHLAAETAKALSLSFIGIAK